MLPFLLLVRPRLCGGPEEPPRLSAEWLPLRPCRRCCLGEFSRDATGLLYGGIDSSGGVFFDFERVIFSGVGFGAVGGLGDLLVGGGGVKSRGLGGGSS